MKKKIVVVTTSGYTNEGVFGSVDHSVIGDDQSLIDHFKEQMGYSDLDLKEREEVGDMDISDTEIVYTDGDDTFCVWGLIEVEM